MPVVRFFEEDIAYKLKHKTSVKSWVNDTIVAEGFILKELNYIFCSDDYLLKVNREYLDHDTFTDIITFDNSEKEKVVIGDVFISIDRIRENSQKFNVTETNELHRVIIHGALHLVGYKDKTAVTKQKMTEKEDFYLNKRGFIG
jgi:probable rRNA maturation factor